MPRTKKITHIEAARQRYRDENNPLLVLAGTYDEYLKFRNTSRRKMIFVHDPQTLYGLKRGTDIIKIGSWYNRRDKDHINHEIKQRQLNEVKKP